MKARLARGLVIASLFGLLAGALWGQALSITTNGSLGTYPIGQDQIALNASGGTGNYTWSLASGSLPPGLNIASIPGSSPVQTGLVGVASAPGNYAFSLKVSDGSTSVTQAFTLKITGLTVKDINLPDAFVNTAFSYTFTPLNNAGPVTFAVTSPPLPVWLNLSPAGVLSGTPTAAGTYNIDFSVSDGVDTTYRGYQLFVYTVDLTTPGALPNATQGVAYSATLSASGGSGGYQYAITGGGLPSGISMSSGGVFSGTVNAGTGVQWFYVTVTDSAHNSYQKTMSIDVVGPTIAQSQITLGSVDDAVVGNTYSWQIATCCGGTAPFTWTASGLPAGMSLRFGSGVTSDYVAPGWAEIWGLASTPGNYNVTVTVTDSLGASSSLNFPFHVSVLTLAPFYNLQPGTINSPYSTAFQIIGGSPPYSISQISGNLPAGLTLNTASVTSGFFSVTGTPSENGNFDPFFKVTDGLGNTLTRENYFTINNLSGGITINNYYDLGSTPVGSFYSNQITACCVANYIWSAPPANLPPGLTFSANGLLSGTPTVAGTYTFLVEAADAAGVAAPGFRQFTLNVSPISITTAHPIPYGNVGSVYSTTFAATGGTGSLAWSVVFGYYLPPGLNLAANGTLSGTPTATGQFYFGVAVADQNNHTATAYYGMNIYAAGALPPVTFASGPDLGTWRIGTDWIALGANGGNGTYTWQVVSGTLPPGLALRSDVPSFFAPNQQAGLIGVATTPGTYTFTLSVATAGQIAQEPFTIKISKLDLQDATPPDAFVNTPFSYTFTPINNAGAVTFTVQSNSTNGTTPPGLSLSSTGVLSGTPTTAGVYVIAMSIFDGVDTQYEQYNLDIYAVNITTPGLLPNATQYSSYSTNLAASGGAGGYVWTANCCLPPGLTLSSTGTISGTITGGPGLYGFVVTATDSNNVSYSKYMALDVIGSPIAPMRITNLTFNDPTLGDHYGSVQSVCCGGTAPFTWTVTGLPPGLATEPNSNSLLQYPSYPGGVQIYGIPQQTGTYNVQFTATDATGASTSASVPMHVSTLDVALAGPDGSFSAYGLPNGTIDVPYSATFRVLGGTGPYSFTQTINGELPDGLSIDSSTLTVSGTPLENGSNFNGPSFLFADSAGNTLFRYEGISISGGTSTIGINSNGFYGYNLGTTPVGVSYSTQFSACCAPSYVWSVAAGSNLPPGLSLSASGQLSGTPTTPRTYTFLIDAADASNPANVGVKSFVLTVTPISITTSSLPYGDVGVPYTGSLAATGATGTLTWTQIFSQGSLLPPGLTLNSNGTISGSPTSAGAYNLILQATDTGGNIAIRAYTIDIYESGPPPLNLPFGRNLGTAQLGDLAYQLSATGGVPPYHYSLTPNATVVPGMRVQDGPLQPTFFQPSITGGYIGVIANPGTYSSSIRVTDSSNNTFDSAFTFTVSPLGILTANPPPNGTLNVPYAFTFTGYGGSGSYSWSANSLPPGLSMNSSGGLSGTPTAAGTYFPVVTIFDEVNSISIAYGYTIQVDPFAITNGAVLPQGTVGTAYSQTLLAPGCGSSCTWTPLSGLLGLSLNPSTGVLSGTPSFTFSGTIRIQASGSNGTVQKFFGITIVSNTPQPLFINMGLNFGIFPVGSQVTIALFAQGGSLPYSWSVVDPADLPPGIRLQSPGETLGANLNPGFAYLWGRGMQAGTYHFTLKVTDGSSNSTTQAFTLTVGVIDLSCCSYNNLPIFNNPLVYNTAYSQALLAQGGSGTYTWATNGPMPPGLSLDPNTGVVTGTPTNTGFFSTPIQITDSAGNSLTRNLNFNIASPTGVTINMAGPFLGTYSGGLQIINLNPSGGTAPYTITPIGSLPAGFTLVSGNQLLTDGQGGYDLDVAQFVPAGNYSFTLQVTDSQGNIAVRTLSLTIAPFQLFTTTSLADGSVGVPYSQQILIWDNTFTVSWSANPGTLPPGLNLVGSTITGTPTAAGYYSFFLNATDASGAVISYTFNLHISTMAITNPATQVIPQQVVVNVPFSLTFTASGGGAVKTWSATGMPTGLTMSAGGVISGTTSAIETLFSPYTITVTVTDGASTLSRLFTLFVGYTDPGNLSFQTTAIPNAVLDQSFSYSLLPTGGTPPYTYTVAPGSTLPPGLQLYTGAQLAPNQAPGGTYLEGKPSVAGSYTFDLIATDSAGAQIRRTFTFQVTSVAILFGGLPPGVIGSPYSTQLTPVGGTPPYTFTYSPTSQFEDMLPAGINPSPTGLISGTPTSTGNFSFVATVHDSNSKTFDITYNLSVTNANGLEVTSETPFYLRAGLGIFLSLTTNGNSSYAWSLAPGSQPLPAGLSLSATGLLTGAPTTPGIYKFTLRATDNSNPANFADRVYTFDIAPIQVILPNAFNYVPPARVGSLYSYTFQVAGINPPYTFETIPTAPGLTLSPAGVLTGTPQASGLFTFFFTVTDSSGFSTNVVAGINILGLGATNTLAGSVLSGSGGVGVPFALELDQSLADGVPPFTWAVAPSYSLPPGLAILPGTGGVSSYLGGVPTAPGNYAFDLIATDSAGQTAPVGMTVTITSISVGPPLLPNGVVGTPYTAALTASGGSGTYTFQLANTSSLPPGLTLDSTGVLSGTPQIPGAFSITATATDQSDNSASNTWLVIIDNALGQTPGIGISPSAALQLNYQLTGPAPAPVPINITSTDAALPFTAMVSGIPGASLSATSGTAPVGLNLSLNTTGLTQGTFAGVVAVSSPESADQFAAIPVVLTVTNAPPCTYSFTSNGNPATGSSVAARGGASTFGVTTGQLCSWSATASDPSWLHISWGSGTGTGSGRFTVDANSSPNSRTNTITVGGQPYTVTEFGSSCAFSINPSSITATAAGGTATVDIFTDGACMWSASGLGATPTSGTGNGIVTLTIPATTAGGTAVLAATIAGQPFSVSQSGIGCTVGLSASTFHGQAAGDGGSVNVTTPLGCSYSTVNGPGWISVSSGSSGAGPGPNPLAFSVAPNSTTIQRSGTLQIGGQIFTINQDGIACSVTMDTSQLGSPFAAVGAGGTIGVTANGPNCSWTASSGSTWAMVAPSSGMGNATINVTVNSNASSATARSTNVTIAGQSLPITQTGTTCTFSLGSGNATAPYTGGGGSVTVTAPAACAWSSSEDPTAPWLHITSSGSGGTSDVAFTVDANPSSIPLTGTLVIAGQNFTVSEGAAPCNYVLSSSATTVSSGGTTNASFTFTTGAAGCSATALSYSSWMTVSTASSADGTSGTVTYSVAPNPAGTTRIGTIQFASQAFTVTQTGAACAYSLNSYGVVFSSTGGMGTVDGSQSAQGCTPEVGATQPSIVTIGALTGPVLDIWSLPFTVTDFQSLVTAVRIAQITFGGQIVTVKQTSW